MTPTYADHLHRLGGHDALPAGQANVGARNAEHAYEAHRVEHHPEREPDVEVGEDAGDEGDGENEKGKRWWGR